MTTNDHLELCLVAMEPMVSCDADEIRNKKVDVLHAVRPIHRDAVGQCAVRGQYGEAGAGHQSRALAAFGLQNDAGVSHEAG